MRFDVDVSLRRSERSFERLIGLVGRRGYELVAVKASMTDDGRLLIVRMTLESERRAETLVRQLERLVEVQSARLAV